VARQVLRFEGQRKGLMHPMLELSKNNHQRTGPAAPRILLAEDDDAMRELIAATLREDVPRSYRSLSDGYDCPQANSQLSNLARSKSSRGTSTLKTPSSLKSSPT
jgi:hypothetical protein